MASAGTVQIDFAAETAKFRAEMKKVRDELAQIRASSKSAADQFESFGNLIKGFAVGATIAAGFREIVQATSEAEEAQAKLTNALQNAGGAFPSLLGDFQEYATKLASTTTLSDEAVQGVEAILLSFKGLSGQTVKDATQAVADLSARMGVDLESAAKLVGNALQDPANALDKLKKSGVAFTAAQKEAITSMVDAGQVGKAQAVILEEIERRYMGAAEAARNTLGGALKALKNQWGELLELNDGSELLTTQINDLNKAISDPQFKASITALFGELASWGAAGAKALGDVIDEAQRLNLVGSPLITKYQHQLEDLQNTRDSIPVYLNFGYLDGSGVVMGPSAIDAKIAELKAKIASLSSTESSGPSHRYNASSPVGGSLTGGGTFDSEDDEKRRADALKKQQELEAKAYQLRLDQAAGLAKANEEYAAQQNALMQAQYNLFSTMTAQEVTDWKAANAAKLADDQAYAASKDPSLAKALGVTQDYLTQENLARVVSHEFDAQQDQVFADIRTAALAQGNEIAKGFLEQDLENQQDSRNKISEMEANLQTNLLNLKKNTTDAAINLLTVFGKKNKAFAIAAQALETAKSVASIIVSTNAAAAAALVPPPMGLGPVAGAALAASTKAWGYSLAALTAGVGIGNIAADASSSSTGSSTSASSSTSATTVSDDSDEAAGASSKSVMTININGDILSSQQSADWFIDQLKSAVNDRDVVVISSNSRQAQELTT
ncbi:MAG: phage tail length tape measure family protein [Steroidobacteraceae bacterium]